MAHIVPVILCGGSGTRLWPVSRQRFPKQFHDIGGEFTLVQETARRALTASRATNFLSVTQDVLRETLASQIGALALPARHHMLLEPSGRNTAAAIAFAALYVERHLDGGILWVLPSDHVINDEVALSQALETAVAAARAGRLVTFGIRPDRPEPGLGYIRTGAPLPRISAAHDVEEFVEKPTMAVAAQYVDSGNYLWNSGMFVMDARTFLTALRRHAPAIETATRQAFATAAIADDICTVQADMYGAIPAAPIDKAVMEKEQAIAVVPCDLGWSDVGSWQSLWDISPKDPDGNVCIGDVMVAGSAHSYFRSKGRLLAAAGVENLAVIDTGDAILVANLHDHQSIRELVSNLQQHARPEAQAPLRHDFAWGSREPLREAPGYALHEFILKPLATLQVPGDWGGQSTQWTAVSGSVSILVAGQRHRLTAGATATAAAGQAVVIEAGSQPVTLLAITVDPGWQG